MLKNNYIRVSSDYQGGYQLKFIDSDKIIVDKNRTPVHSFNTRKEAREWITKNWENIKQYN